MFYLEARLRDRVGHWPLTGTTFSVGRNDECDIVLDDPTVSRRHLRLTIEGRAIRLDDLGSAHGVRVDGSRVESTTIAPGRWFAAGAVMLVVRRGVTVDTGGRRRAVPTPASGDRPTVHPADASEGHDALERSNARADLPSRLDELAGELEHTTRADEAIDALLRFLVEHCAVRGAVLVQRRASAWNVAALCGEALPRDLLEPLAALVADGEFAARQSGDVLLQPVPDDGKWWLVLHPWSSNRAPVIETRVVAALCAHLRTAGPPEAERIAAAGNRAAAESEPDDPDFVAVSAACRAMLRDVDRLARISLPILLQGESGTGKELLARRIHARSPRRDGPFEAINCAALPRDLLEAELFGIERGVATGVEPRPGRFMLATGGTLFLDEVADMPMDLQPKLLRALESGQIARLGARKPVPIDVRIVAATHQDLEDLIARKVFRRDLYHRIAGGTISVPPLRERPEDILPLARTFIRRAGGREGHACAGIDLEAARLLVGYPWPGNVRELQHAMARAVALAEGPVILAEHLPSGARAGSDVRRGDALLALDDDLRTARRAFEVQYFERLVRRASGNLSEVARMAGLTRSHLYTKLEELGLRTGD